MDYEYLRGNDGTGPAVLAHVTASRSIGATVLEVDSVDNWPDKFICTTGQLLPTGFLDPDTITEFTGHLNAGDIEIDGFEPGFPDIGNTTNDVAIIKPTGGFPNRVAELAQVSHEDDGSLNEAALGQIYPVGSVYINAAVATNPATLLGFGTWAAFGQGRVMVGVDAGQAEFDTLGETGGAKTHTLTSAEIPAHTHAGGNLSVKNDNPNDGNDVHGGSDGSGTAGTVTMPTTASAGGGGAHNNLQPYITVYMWKRTA